MCSATHPTGMQQLPKELPEQAVVRFALSALLTRAPSLFPTLLLRCFRHCSYICSSDTRMRTLCAAIVRHGSQHRVFADADH